MSDRHLVLNFDGSYSMKRHRGAGGAVAYLPDGQEIGYRCLFITDLSTPAAEYTGLIMALMLAQQLEATSVKIWGDAELICRQVQPQKDNPHGGTYACRDTTLQPYLALVKRLMSGFEHADVFELPKAGEKMKRRHNNQRADEIAGDCQESGVSLTYINKEMVPWIPT